MLQIVEAPDGSIWTVVNGAAMVFNGKRWLDGGVLGGIPHEGGIKAVFFDRQGTQWIFTARSGAWAGSVHRDRVTYQRG